MKKHILILLSVILFVTFALQSVALAAENHQAEALPSPQNLKTAGVYYNQVNLTWNSVRGAKGYYIYRSLTKTGGYQKIASVRTVTSHRDNTVKRSTKYYYKVFAYTVVSGKITKSAASRTISATTPTRPAIVYWTPSGAVYHRISNCPSLARSKTILSGSIGQSGKNRPCNICW